MDGRSKNNTSYETHIKFNQRNDEGSGLRGPLKDREIVLSNDLHFGYLCDPWSFWRLESSNKEYDKVWPEGR